MSSTPNTPGQSRPLPPLPPTPRSRRHRRRRSSPSPPRLDYAYWRARFDRSESLETLKRSYQESRDARRAAAEAEAREEESDEEEDADEEEDSDDDDEDSDEEEDAETSRPILHDPDMASPNAFPALDTSMPSGNRAVASPTGSSHAGASVANGNGVGAAAASAGYMAPLPVGHQQDLNYLYAQIQELSSILRSNREKTNLITRTAEEVARRANGSITEAVEGGSENDQQRIRELELELAKSKHLIELYKHEQKENTNLIAMYEDALGTATEQIRNYCTDIEGRFLRQRRHYNDLLQQEKDDHLQSRLDRDHWYAQTLKVCEMIRTAHRLRTDEWCEEYTIIAGLQGEVRCLRRVLGMEAEKPEDETGWPYLKDLPLNDQA